MKFLPWDRLQQDSSNNYGNRVTKGAVKFRLLRTYRLKIVWDALSFKNGAYFHGGIEKEIDAFFKNLLKQSKKFSGDVELSLYHLSEAPDARLEALEEDSPTFRYHLYKAPLEALLQDFLKFREDVRKVNLEEEFIESPYRKVLIPIIMLGDKEIDDLRNDSKLSKMMVSLLQDSSDERIHPFLFCESPVELPDEVLDALDWAAYLGHPNAVYARDILHKGMEESLSSYRQEVVGAVAHVRSDELIIAHPLKFSPSDFYFKEKQQLVDEDEIYMKYLNSLNDGT